jgi:predicted esterase
VQAHHLRVQRTARFHTQGDLAAEPRELWYVLHGYGQLARHFLAELEPLARPGRLLVAPEGLSRFYLRGTDGRIGASWMTREDRAHEIVDYVEWLDELHRHLQEQTGSAGARVGVLGFSQGTATAARWAVLGRVRPARLILWAGGLPPDLDPAAIGAALSGVQLELVAGDQDEYLPEARIAEEERRMQELGLAAVCQRFPGGHRLDAALLTRHLAPR